MKDILNCIRIDILGEGSCRIIGKDFDFAYNQPDSIVKPEFRGKYRNLGGLQSNYGNDSAMHKNLEECLITLSEVLFKHINEITQNESDKTN